MKKFVVYILCFTCMVLLFTGCSNPKPTPGTDSINQVGNTQATQNIQDTTQTQPVHSNPPAPTMPEGTPLTTDELAWFNDEFFSGAWTDEEKNWFFNIRNMYMQIEFATVEELDIGLLFRNGVRPTKEPITQKEIDAFEQIAGRTVSGEVIKISRWDLEMAYLHTTGSTVKNTQTNGFENLVYLEEYDAYYTDIGSIEPPRYEIKEGIKLQGGQKVVLRYQQKQETTTDWIVTLSSHEDTYWFVSNLPIK